MRFSAWSSDVCSSDLVEQRRSFDPGELVDARQCLVAEPALGRVDDTFEGEVIGRRLDEAEIGEGIADFGALVEAEAADDAVRHADRDEAILELAGLEIGRASCRERVCQYV